MSIGIKCNLLLVVVVVVVVIVVTPFIIVVRIIMYDILILIDSARSACTREHEHLPQQLKLALLENHLVILLKEIVLVNTSSFR